ncbi:MAG: hypothetical protein ABJF88_17020 [Rhodothermales bacterium]
MKAMREDWEDPVVMSHEGEGTGCFEALSVSDERLLQVSETMTKFNGYRTHWEGEKLVGSGPSSWALLNAPILFEREPEGWAVRLLGPNATEEMESMIEGRPFELEDAYFPSASVEVGQKWTVPIAVLDQIHESRYPATQKAMTMQIDSVDTWGGEPAAFISYTLDIVRPNPSLHHHAEGRMVRSLVSRINLYETAKRTEAIDFVAALTDGLKVDGKSITTFWYEVRRRTTPPSDSDSSKP